jgi:RNA polymerase sigma-70 factor (ECF subfamily)
MLQAESKQDESWVHLRSSFNAYRDGDATVVGLLFSELGERLNRFFMARTRNAADSDDLTQATLLKIHLSRQSFKSSLSLKTWAFTIAQRTLIDHWRKKGRKILDDPLEDVESSNHSIHDNSNLDLPSRIALRQSLEKVISNLKPLDRSIVYLSVEEGLSMAELAQVLNSTEGAVKVKVHRLLKGLREMLNEASESEGAQA